MEDGQQFKGEELMSNFEDEYFRVNFLHSNNIKDIEILDAKPKGFTHILRFYK